MPENENTQEQATPGSDPVEQPRLSAVNRRREAQHAEQKRAAEAQRAKAREGIGTTDYGEAQQVGFAPTGADEGMRSPEVIEAQRILDEVQKVRDDIVARTAPSLASSVESMPSRDFVRPEGRAAPLPGDFVMPPPPAMSGNVGDIGAPPEGVPAPKAFFSAPSSYLTAPRDFMASSVGMVVTSYTFDASTVTADDNGNKIVQEGTTLAKSTGDLVKVCVDDDTAIGILRRRINARDGNVDVGVLVGGTVNRHKIWDREVFGVVSADTIEDLPFIHFRNEDV